jgi:molybdopterin-containing oxidoreductase family iron-sulfur binding subunit
MANFYASTYINEGDAIPVVVKQRDGRPIKIEGNEMSSITKGGTSAAAQASVLDLYDTTRLRYPMQKVSNSFKEVSTFDALDKMLANDIQVWAESQLYFLLRLFTLLLLCKLLLNSLRNFPGAGMCNTMQ